MEWPPLKIVLSVRTYVPMGPAIMARVKASSLMMTELERDVMIRLRASGRGRAHAGTAGAMLDFSDACGVAALLSSFSRIFFSLEMIRLDVMAEGVRDLNQ